jgi:hypothetical protein
MHANKVVAFSIYSHAYTRPNSLTHTEHCDCRLTWLSDEPLEAFRAVDDLYRAPGGANELCHHGLVLNRVERARAVGLWV